MGMKTRGTDIAIGHGSDSSAELFDNGFRGAPTLTNITLLATAQANVVGHLNVHPSAKQATQLGPVQCEETFDEDELRGLERVRHPGARVAGKVVVRDADGA